MTGNSARFIAFYDANAGRAPSRLDVLIGWPEAYPSWLPLWTWWGLSARLSWLWRHRIRRFHA
jgi:hypothetical protein